MAKTKKYEVIEGTAVARPYGLGGKRRTFVKGQICESETDLAKVFPNKWRLVHRDEDPTPVSETEKAPEPRIRNATATAAMETKLAESTAKEDLAKTQEDEDAEKESAEGSELDTPVPNGLEVRKIGNRFDIWAVGGDKPLNPKPLKAKAAEKFLAEYTPNANADDEEEAI